MFRGAQKRSEGGGKGHWFGCMEWISLLASLHSFCFSFYLWLCASAEYSLGKYGQDVSLSELPCWFKKKPYSSHLSPPTLAWLGLNRQWISRVVLLPSSPSNDTPPFTSICWDFLGVELVFFDLWRSAIWRILSRHTRGDAILLHEGAEYLHITCACLCTRRDRRLNWSTSLPPAEKWSMLARGECIESSSAIRGCVFLKNLWCPFPHPHAEHAWRMGASLLSLFELCTAASNALLCALKLPMLRVVHA